jgi:hypothetical protein
LRREATSAASSQLSDLFILRLQNSGFSIFAFLADFATYRLVLQKMAIFCVSQKFYIADRAFFDLIFSFWHKPSAAKTRKKHFREKTRFFKKVNFAFFCPSRFFGKKS